MTKRLEGTLTYSGGAIGKAFSITDFKAHSNGILEILYADEAGARLRLVVADGKWIDFEVEEIIDE